MIISVLNKKGGVGKTPFALSLAKDLKLFLQSNDNSTIEQLYPNMAKISKEPQLLVNCVYDFGGFVDKGMLNIIKNSNYIIIPTLPTYNSILRSIETISELEKFNKNILVLITGYSEESKREELEKAFKNKFDFLKYFYFRQSKIVENSIVYGMSFTELYSQSGLSKSSYKKFFKEYEKLLNYLK